MGTIYLKITDKNNSSRIEAREAWDEKKFLESVIKQYGENEDNPCRIEVVTRQDYLRQIKR